MLLPTTPPPPFRSIYCTKSPSDVAKKGKATLMKASYLSRAAALQRTNTENLIQIFSEKELSSHSPNFHIHVSVSDLYMPIVDLPILRQENCGLILGINKSLTDT
jgi:hypothetical protein